MIDMRLTCPFPPHPKSRRSNPYRRRWRALRSPARSAPSRSSPSAASTSTSCWTSSPRSSCPWCVARLACLGGQWLGWVGLGFGRVDSTLTCIYVPHPPPFLSTAAVHVPRAPAALPAAQAQAQGAGEEAEEGQEGGGRAREARHHQDAPPRPGDHPRAHRLHRRHLQRQGPSVRHWHQPLHAAAFLSLLVCPPARRPAASPHKHNNDNGLLLIHPISPPSSRFAPPPQLFNPVEIKPEMVGMYSGEFSMSYRCVPYTHTYIPPCAGALFACMPWPSLLQLLFVSFVVCCCHHIDSSHTRPLLSPLMLRTPHRPVKHGRPGIGSTNSSRFIPLK